MSKLQFPSGPWTGYFNYDAGGQRFRTDMIIAFAHQRITGEGGDLIGPFIIDGHYDDGAGECAWQKSYVGAHEVWYTGFREGKGIWGTWAIPGSVHGGFQIWPVGDEPADAIAATKEEDVPEPARAQ